MNFTVEKSILEKLVKDLIPFTDKRDESNISSCINIKVKDFDLVLNATDYEMGMTKTVNNIINPMDGECNIVAAKLLSAITRLKNGEIIITVDNDILTIKQKRSKINIELFDDEFPPNTIDIDKMTNIDLDINDINNSFNSVLSGVDGNNPKFELNGVLLDINNKNINTVSTDTRCLIVDKKNTIIDNDISIIIPKKAVLEIQKIMNVDCKIYIDDIHIVIDSGNVSMRSKLINGKFPDYNRVIPKKFNHIFVLNKDELVESVKVVTGFDTIINITFNKDNILIESGDNKNKSETYIENVNLDIDDEIKVRIDSKFLLNFLNVIDDDFEFCFNDKNLPISLKKHTLENIIMPVMSD